ncbi:MAG: type II toxin-antitoxin system HicB family antitoxin [Synergistaceae bacterium]|jgi:predicted RNase H-like HicB family nuclease|nr:type II toxin-antitoxin system HicB family antitoxin [Synergistaceae bacterium]
MEYVYPAVFHSNDDESYTITYPDLPGCISEGKSLGNALHMAASALNLWIAYLIEKREEIPAASRIEEVKVDFGEFVNLIRVNVRDEHAVRRTVSIPKWMDDEAMRSGLSLSQILQDALSKRLHTV